MTALDMALGLPVAAVVWVAASIARQAVEARAARRRRAMAVYPPRRTPEPPRVRLLGAFQPKELS